MEASIPISILAIGLARAFNANLLENVILTGIGGTSGAVVAGAIFTLPALYILQLSPHPLQTMLICLAGGCLGVLFLIPLRRFFVREMHGQLPYPEATAITEVLVTGERGGVAGEAAAAGDAARGRLRLLRHDLPGVEGVRGPALRPRDGRSLHEGEDVVQLRRRRLHPRARATSWASASSTLLCAGGVLSNFVLVPLIWMIGQHLGDQAVYPATVPIAQMTAEQIFRGYVRFVGVGAIATAGIFGIVKSLKVVYGSFAIAARTFRRGEAHAGERTDRDLSVAMQLVGVVISAVVVAAFFGTLSPTVTNIALGLGLTLVFSFFFASVAANAIATTARNPVSGMTMLTIIISAVVLLRFGVSGTSGMFFLTAIAGMVCTALSVSGQTITDLKTGYWLGSTPAVQQRVKFLGVAVSAVAAALTIAVLAKVYQFGEALPGDTREVLAAPQASIMKALIEGFMSQQPVAMLLFASGAMIAVAMEMLGVPALIVALGMYLPLELNLPALVGGVLSHYVNRRADAAGERGRSMRERGVIIASGFMAGGALGGVLGASLRLFPWYSEGLIKTPFFDIDPVSQTVSHRGLPAVLRLPLGVRAEGGGVTAGGRR